MQDLSSESESDWADFTGWMLMAQDVIASLDGKPTLGI